MADSARALDTFDRQTLARMQTDLRQLAEGIATAIGLSATAAQRRIPRVREVGVFQGERLLLDAAALGHGLAVWVEVVLREASRKAVIDGFKRRMAVERCVHRCFYVAGDSDFLLLVRCRDVVAFQALTRELFFDDANIPRFRSVFVLDECNPDAGFYDGFRCNTEGRIWTSAGRAIHCDAPDSALIGRIGMPERVSTLVFGGPKRDRLFICATSSVYALLLAVNGVKPC